MSFAEIFLIAAGLAMDAFAVSISDGMVISRRSKCVFMAAMCGIFQAAMPFIGYILGGAFSHLIAQWDHWVALLALGIIGGKALYEAITELHEGGSAAVKEPSCGIIIAQAAATSIDALVIGVSLAAVGADIMLSSAVIGLVAFLLCLVGVSFGRRLGSIFGTRAAAAGGVTLIAIGIKIFIEHSFFS